MGMRRGFTGVRRHNRKERGVARGLLQRESIFEAHCGRSLEVAVGYGMADKSEQIRSCVVTDDNSFEQGVQLNQ